MTFRMLAPLLLAVAGSVVYHVSAKSIPKAFDPFAALIGLYATALAGSIVAFVSTRAAGLSPPSRLWHPTIAAVGIGALLIEMGFLLAYRSAWPVSTAGVVTNGLVAVLLLGIGVVGFGEPITPAKAVGIVLVLAGVTLLQT